MLGGASGAPGLTRGARAGQVKGFPDSAAVVSFGLCRLEQISRVVSDFVQCLEERAQLATAEPRTEECIALRGQLSDRRMYLRAGGRQAELERTPIASLARNQSLANERLDG